MSEQYAPKQPWANQIAAALCSHYAVILTLSLLLAVQIFQNQMLIRRISGSPAAEGSSIVGSNIVFPELETVEGKAFSFNHTSKHLIIYFHTDCPYCHHDIPLWQMIQAQSKKYDLYVVAVTQEDDRSKIAQFAREARLSFPILLDPEQKLIGQLQAAGTPTKVLTGPGGQVTQVWRGLTTRESGEAAIGGLMLAFGIAPDGLPQNANLP
ncbi:MAG TPA: TlpA disulfide reductase family protein [Roseiflexaceae bacterium]|nr:TlpA disulfide reductase family protein [Roseiflexaceae bacterium]